MKNLVVLTGAGMSAESGISTFRDAGGLWDRYPVEQVATPEGYQRDPALVINFYNERRKQLLEVKPNRGHELLAELEKNFHVTVVTQNIDNLHERAGSSHIIHLHGELTKVCSSRDPHNPHYIKELKPEEYEVKMGDKAGTLRVEFVGVDKTGFANFNSMEVEEELSATDGYVQYTCSGLWNGTGDFKLSFTGDIYLYMLILSTDRVESLTHRYKTLFEQSERLVKISAAVFDKDENLLEETGLMVTSKYSGLYAIDGDGNLKSLVGVGGDGVKIKGDNITLEGLVTANDNFKILEDGSIETRNAKIYGTVYAYEGKIGGFTIDSGRLYWKAGDYFGNDSRSLKLGVSQTDMEGIVDVSFNAATQGRFGVKAVGSNLGGAAIYASSKSSGQSYPISANTYAGYFDGGVHVNGAVYCGDILSNNYGTGWSLASDGTYSYRKGVSGTFQWAVKSDFITYNYTLEVVNGIVVKMTYI